MSDINEVQRFLLELRTHLDGSDGIRAALTVSQVAQKSPVCVVRVLATCMKQILMEANAYLDYYQERIEKCFQAAPVKDETRRVQEAIFSKFCETLDRLQKQFNDDKCSSEAVVDAFGELIQRWAAFDKVDMAQILPSGAS